MIENEIQFHIRDYFKVLRRRFGVILTFFVSVVLAVTVGSFLMKPVYRAKATILIDLENPNVLTSTGMVELQSQNYFSYKEYYQSQKEILTSLPILKKVFDEFNVGKEPEYQGLEDPLKKFMKTVSVSPVKETRLLDLYVENPDPEIAAKIANRIAEIYVKRNLFYISKTELLNLLKNEYLKFEAKLSEYSKIYKESHPDMIRLRQEMSELVDKIEKEKELALKHDEDSQQELLDYKYGLEGLKANNVSVLSRADVPLVPVRPKRLLNFFIAIMAGAIGGIVLAFFVDYLDDSVKEAGDIEGVANWPILGSIPSFDKIGKLSEREKDTLVHQKPKEPASEAYRIVRTSLLFSSTEEHPLHCLIVTSTSPQEGKTMTLCNLGIAIAQNRKKVLLVDADMRNPRVHEIFKTDMKNGFSTFLSGQADFDEVVKKTEIENLSIVSSGIHPPNPSELLASHKMAEFVAKARTEFDFILFDTPPVNIITDAVVLSAAADGIVIVIENGKTSRRALVYANRILESAKAKVIGIIFNKLSTHNDNYYYHSYYYSRKV